LERVRGSIAGKERQLGNENFTSRAPANVVEAERKALDELRERLGSLEKTIAALKAQA
jgi:valyl-tRNA synthetase